MMKHQGGKRTGPVRLVSDDGELHLLAVHCDGNHRSLLGGRRHGREKKEEDYSAGATRRETIRWCRLRTVSLPRVRHNHGKRPCTKHARLPSSIRVPKPKAIAICCR